MSIQNGNFSTSDGANPQAAARPVVWNLGQLVGEVVNDASEAHEARKTGQPRGPLTGLKQLDEKIGGCLPKNALTVVLGNTGAGKTAFGGQIAASCHFPAVYLTTEMAPAELLRRHTARETETYLNRFKTGEMMPQEVESLVKRTAEAAPLLHIIDGTTAYAPIAYLQEVLEIAKGKARHALLVVDSLHTWARGANVGASEYDTLNAHLTALGQLAKQAKCSIMVICEQSRAAMQGGGVNSGAGTRFIEYGADLVLDLQAETKQDGAGEKPVSLTLAKNRNGAPNMQIKLSFNGALQRFKEVEK